MYGVQSAEKTTFPDAHFDLVCVAQALHWFDYANYWPEVQRVLKPNGLFAAWGYSWFNITPAINDVIDQHLRVHLRPYWAKQNQLLWDSYANVPFPLTRIESPQFSMSLEWSLDELFNYLHSWSAVRRCMDANGKQFFEDAYSQVADVWGNDKSARHLVTMPICTLFGRNC